MGRICLLRQLGSLALRVRIPIWLPYAQWECAGRMSVCGVCMCAHVRVCRVVVVVEREEFIGLNQGKAGELV